MARILVGWCPACGCGHHPSATSPTRYPQLGDPLGRGRHDLHASGCLLWGTSFPLSGIQRLPTAASTAVGPSNSSLLPALPGPVQRACRDSGRRPTGVGRVPPFTAVAPIATPSGDTRIIRRVDGRPRPREHSHHHKHDVDVSRGAPLGARLSRRTKTRCRVALRLGLSRCHILGTELRVPSAGDRMAYLPTHKGGLHRRRIVRRRTDRPGRCHADLTTADGRPDRPSSSRRSYQWPSLWRVPFGGSGRVRVVERKLGVPSRPGPSNRDRLAARPRRRSQPPDADHRRVFRTSRRDPVCDSGVGARHDLSQNWTHLDRVWAPRSLG